MVEFAYNNSYQATIGMAPYEALYGKKCKSPLYWDEVGERKILGPEAIAEMIEKIRQIRLRIKEAQDRQKSYADTRRTELSFHVGDKVFLKVSPSKGVTRFGAGGKLKPRYIGPMRFLKESEQQHIDWLYRLILGMFTTCFTYRSYGNTCMIQNM